MNAPGLYSFGDYTIAAAGVQVSDVIDGLEGIEALTISARLAYGAGGTTVIAVISTSIDQGTTWIEIARLDFATSGLQKVVNLSGLTPRTSPLSVAALGSEGCNDGVLGDRLKCTVTSAGTYTGSTVLSVRAACR